MLVIRLDKPARNTLVVNNGNRTGWSPIPSVIREWLKNTRSSNLFNHEYDYIDRVGRHKVLSLIHYNYDKICDILSLKN